MRNKISMSNIMKATIVSALAASVTGSFTGCESTQVKELKDLLDAGAYSEAVSYYQTNHDKLADKNLDEVINTSADNIYNSYLSGSLSASNAISQLESIKAIGSDSSDEYIDERKALIDSNVSFKEGQTYLENKDYLSAIEAFKKVIESDSNYTTAQSKIKETEQLYKDSILSKAESYIQDGDYSEAINYLTGFLEQFTNDQDIKDKIDAYKDAMLDSLLPEVNDFIKKGDYYNALVGIAALEEDYGDSKKLQTLRETTETQYLQTVIPIIDEYIKNEDYINAYSVCVNAMEVIKDSNELQSRHDQIEPLKPILLSEMKISESEYFEQLTDHTISYEDVIGNSYNPGNLYRLHMHNNDSWGNNEQGYAKVYLNSQYTSLTGTVTLDDTSDKGDCVVTILVDDKEVYKEKFNRASTPKDINIDVKGKQWLQIMISPPEEDSESSGNSGTYNSEILVVNFAFSK